MVEIATGARAKTGYIATKRYRKDGAVVAARDAVVPMNGMFSAKEAEKVMRDVAREHGADESQIRIETYGRAADAPMTTDPRRGSDTRLWGGWSPPDASVLSALPGEFLWGRREAHETTPGQGKGATDVSR